MITMFEITTRDWIIMLNPRSHPDELVVEIATTCNMDCRHCFRKASKDLRLCVMSFKLFEKIVDECVKYGVKKIVFSGWGEPLTHPEIVNMIKLSKKVGLDVAINTNGLELSKFLDIAIDYVDELYISLDAATPQTHGVVRALSTFNSIVKNIKELVRIKQLRGLLKPVIKLVFTINIINVDEVGPFLSLAMGLGVNEVVFTCSIPYSELDSIGCLNSVDCLDNFFKKFDNVIGKLKEFGLRITLPHKSYTQSLRCPFAVNRALFIRCDGAVAPCIHYAYSWTPVILGIKRHVKAVILGYIEKEELIDIWRRKYAKMLFRLNLKRSPPSCLACTLAEYCTKTRSNDADCLGNEPNCGHCPFYHGLTYCPL